jgi:RimJ/RimL family protein N-acetyltransferase
VGARARDRGRCSSGRLGLGELGYARVVSITVEANTASRNVMAKLGLRLHERVPSEWGELWVHALDRKKAERLLRFL